MGKATRAGKGKGFERLRGTGQTRAVAEGASHRYRGLAKAVVDVSKT
jgi:hypothetical protein